jgi:uncharacterized damage-inducible protein DinB
MLTPELIRHLWAHAAWADALVLDALLASEAADAHADAWREYAHVLGAESTWLARLELHAPPVAVWPTLTRDEIVALRQRILSGYDAYLARADDATLSQPVEYTNSAGQTFRTLPYDVLLQVVLHGQYHRGKINLLLRQGGADPAPVDFIAYVRGVPAAVTPVAPPISPGVR